MGRMGFEGGRYILTDGQILDVARDATSRELTFSVGDNKLFSMHQTQGYHLAKFIAGIRETPAHSTDHDFDDTQPARKAKNRVLDLTDTEDGDDSD